MRVVQRRTLTYTNSQLLRVRCGQGAALLPNPPSFVQSTLLSERPSGTTSPSSVPRLTSVILTFPLGPPPRYIEGSLKFWRKHLRRLKYWNPWLSITVKHERGNITSPMWLQLVFEGSQEVLASLSPGYEDIIQPKQKRGELQEPGEGTRAETQSPNLRDTPAENRSSTTPEETPKKRVAQLREEALQDDLSRLAQTTKSLSSKSSPEPPVDSTSTPLSKVKPQSASQREEHPLPSSEITLLVPATESEPSVYTRTLTLPARNLTPARIWQWFQSRTQCVELEPTEEDKAESREGQRREIKLAALRALSLARLEEQRKEENLLEQARAEFQKKSEEA